MSRPVAASQLAAARQTLASLRMLAWEARAELQELRSQLAEVRTELGFKQGEVLRQANEHLVLAALHAERVAEAALVDLDKLAQANQRDILTGTPNRMLLLDRLESALALARRRGSRSAVLFLDIDHFKQINDTLGHAVGDEVLKVFARRLEAAVRDSDTVSRYGGDEFLILLPEISRAGDAELIATKVLAELTPPGEVGPHRLDLSASIGIALYPEDGADAATLINHADAAMYRCKRAGGSGYVFHRQPSE
ncbi:GGDEF domain-containing protein [Azospira oryzae]|uniref:GGDEF domain-containing protein n=1 Tax=Azospira oryzae TaxID=146939 RepID=UPI0019622DBD|nr:GGDEF domain-containing protein [Azospira oryzae]